MSIYLSQPATILSYLKAGIAPGTVKAYYLTGDPLKIPLPNLPAVIVELDSSRHEVGPTSQDLDTHTTIIKLVYNKKDDFLGSVTQDMTREKMRKLIEERDGTTLQYLPTTILGILRKHITQGSRFTSMVIDVRYGIIPRPSNVLCEEAQITITTKEYIPISNRD